MLIKLILLAAGLLLLSACGNTLETEQSREAALAQAIADGYLLPPGTELPQPETTVVTRRTLTHVEADVLSPVYLIQRHLYFDTPTRTLAAIHVERGQRVRAGDVLAELVPLDIEAAERLFLRQRNAQIELERADRDFNNERERRLVHLERVRDELELADDDEWPRLALDLNRLELTYRQFLLNNEQNRARLVQQLENINDQIAGDQIIAPFDGIVLFSSIITPGTLMQGRPRIITLAKEDSLRFQFEYHEVGNLLAWYDYTRSTRAAILYRHGDILPMVMTIPAEEISVEFQVRVVNDTWVLRGRSSGNILFEPTDWDALHEAFGTYDVNPAMARIPIFSVESVIHAYDVLSIPMAAINTVNDRIYVYVNDQGNLRRQNVTLGVRDITMRERYTEVLSGLHEGQEVVVR
ncbi:MAG: biotin/lipoyl-binding protein [Defluviitaleaceae bacterium]|nr:biotin/lipoyl-binding protein [Defluviitaleaceae bacterium]